MTYEEIEIVETRPSWASTPNKFLIRQNDSPAGLKIALDYFEKNGVKLTNACRCHQSIYVLAQ